jgi:hypothetical protein
VNARRQLEGVLGKRLAEAFALIGVLRRGRPHELVLDGRRRRLWLYFAGNCRHVPQGTAPAYRPDLADGCLDIRVVEATVLARSRLVAAVLNGTLGRSRVYLSWRASSVDVRRRTVSPSGRPPTARWPPPNLGSSTASTRTRWWSTARPTASQAGDVAPRRAALSGEGSKGG